VLGNIVHAMKLTKVMIRIVNRIYVFADDRIVVAYRRCMYLCACMCV